MRFLHSCYWLYPALLSFFITHTAFCQVDYDGDGVSSYYDADRDNDGIPDRFECTGYLAQNNNGTWAGVTTSTITFDYQTAFDQSNFWTYTGTQFNYHQNLNGGEMRKAKYGNADFTITFSPAVPADEIAFFASDVDPISTSTLVTATYTITVNGGAPNGVFIEEPSYSNMNYNGVTGIATLNNSDNQAFFLRGVGSTLINEIKIQSSGVGSPTGDLVAYSFFARVPCDTDGDGIQNFLDLDSDGDLCPDAIEGDGNYMLNDLITSGMNGGNTGPTYTGLTSPVIENLGTSSLGNGNVTSGTQGIGTSQTFEGVTTCAIMLPVTLADVDANCENGNLNVNCTTLSENNSDLFTIQISKDGEEFEDIGQVNAAGFSQSPINYNWSDRISNAEGLIRLLETDLDGSTMISELMYFQCKNEQPLQLYPVPAQNVLVISNSGKYYPSIALVDVTGKTIEEKTFDHIWNEISFDTSQLESGIYYVVLSDYNQVETLKALVLH